MADEFKPGDEVQHLTGKQKMIFTGMNVTGEAICEWFDGKKRQQETFSLVALKRYQAPALGGPPPTSYRR